MSSSSHQLRKEVRRLYSSAETPCLQSRNVQERTFLTVPASPNHHIIVILCKNGTWLRHCGLAVHQKYDGVVHLLTFVANLGRYRVLKQNAKPQYFATLSAPQIPRIFQARRINWVEITGIMSFVPIDIVRLQWSLLAAIAGSTTWLLTWAHRGSYRLESSLLQQITTGSRRVQERGCI